MNFTELVRGKIEERRRGRSAAVQAAADADGRFRTRATLLLAAVSEMLGKLSDNPMFALAMGRSEVTVRRQDKEGQEGSLTFEGPVGSVSFSIDVDGSVSMRIYPSLPVASALDCGLAYGTDPVRGGPYDIDEFIPRVRDHLGDFLADIYLSPAAHLVQPEAGRPTA